LDGAGFGEHVEYLSDGSLAGNGVTHWQMPSFDEHVEYLSDGSLAGNGVTQWQMPLDLIPVSSTVLLLDDVARFSQVGDNPEGAAVADIQRCGDVAQKDAGVVRDTDQSESVVAQNAALRHTHRLQ
jgi:hypothetical protein